MSKLDRSETTVVNKETGGTKGTKLARMDLLPWDQLYHVAELYGVGAEKYSPSNWRSGYDYSLSIAALSRHLALYASGENVDGETGCHHMTSVVFHALALMYFDEAHPELDDRFKTNVRSISREEK